MAIRGIFFDHDGTLVDSYEGIEKCMQLTCRDRNRIALQGDLLGAAALGVENVLVLGGDQVTAGDHPEAKAVFDLSSQELLGILHTMAEHGEIRSGRTRRIASTKGGACCGRSTPEQMPSSDILRRGRESAPASR